MKIKFTSGKATVTRHQTAIQPCGVGVEQRNYGGAVVVDYLAFSNRFLKIKVLTPLLPPLFTHCCSPA